MQTPEFDLILMSALIFTPALFALVLVFFPAGGNEEVGSDEEKHKARSRNDLMRWWTLAGTALTLGLSLCVFLSFKNDVVDYFQRGTEGRKAGQLDERAKRLEALERDKGATGGNAQTDKPGNDWLSRYPWIEPFRIQYFLGTDGISLAMILVTTVTTFLAMIASWNIKKFVKGYCILILLPETG